MPSDTTAHVVASPTEVSADTATVASGAETSANNGAVANTTVENTVANTATTNTVTETPVATVEANTATETPAVASGDRASAMDASTTSPYVSDQAKQSVQDNLVPLAKSTTPAPTAEQLYKENPTDASKLTADDRVVESESKEAFDKLPDSVRRRVKSVTIEKKENGNLGHTASISGNVTLNAQYFHNDSKNSETEVLYHEIGHAIDGATYKRNADGSDYSLSRDTAVQPLIQKVYPGQVNYEGWASMFGTYMLQKTGQREIKTDLDREINDYFTALMMGFTEEPTTVSGRFAVTGTDQSKKHLTKDDLSNGVYHFGGTYTFDVSGPRQISGAKMILELPASKVTQVELRTSRFNGLSSDISDTNTVRYEIPFETLSGSQSSQITFDAVLKGKLFTGLRSDESVEAVVKIVKDGKVLDSDTISVTSDRVKGGLYRSDSVKPNSIRDINSYLPERVTVGVYDSESQSESDELSKERVKKSNQVRLVVPIAQGLVGKDNGANMSDYERYSSFDYSISGLPDYLKLASNESYNDYWTLSNGVLKLKPKAFTSGIQYVSVNDMKPVLELDTSNLSSDQIASLKKGYIMNLVWKTTGELSDKSVYSQELADTHGIELKIRDLKEKSPEGSIVLNYGRILNAVPLRKNINADNEKFRIESTMIDRDQSGAQATSQYYYIDSPSDQSGDHFTSFELRPALFRYTENGKDTNMARSVADRNLESNFELYGVRSDGTADLLKSWSKLSAAAFGGSKYNDYHVDIDANYQRLIVKTPVLRDTASESSTVLDSLYGWGADVTYSVDKTRWNRAVDDRTVTSMKNGLRTDFVRSGNTLDDALNVERKSLTEVQLNENSRIYNHTRRLFDHKLSGEMTNSTLGFNDASKVGIYGDLNDYYGYLHSTRNELNRSRLDTINKAYTTVLVPDGLIVKDAQVLVNNNLLSSRSRLSEVGLADANYSTSKVKPIDRVVNYNNTGKTLYVFETVKEQDILEKASRLSYTTPLQLDPGVTDTTYRPSVEMVFNVVNDGSVKPGNYDIQYSVVWDSSSELIRSVESQALNGPVTGQSLSDVLPKAYQDGVSYGSTVKVPFKVEYLKDSGSRLYIGNDEFDSFSSSLEDVRKGSTVNLRSQVFNYSDSDVELHSAIVTVPAGQFKTSLASKLDNGSDYKVLYSTDTTDPVSANYSETVDDLNTVTAVKYVFSTPRKITAESSFVSNMQVNVDSNAAPKLTDISKMYVSYDGNSYLQANNVSLTTLRPGSVTVDHRDTDGLFIVDTEYVKKDAPDGESYSTSPLSSDRIVTPKGEMDLNGHRYDYTSEDITGYKLVKKPDNAEGVVVGGKTINVTYVYDYVNSVVINGSAIATYKDEAGNVLAETETLRDDVKPGTKYVSFAKTIAPKFENVSQPNGTSRLMKVSYELIATPSNASGEIVGNRTIEVPYVYRRIVETGSYGSVIATYKDTEGNELAPQENVKTDVPDGEAYTTVAKTIPSSEVVEKTPEGLTKRTTTSYELTETPANANGNVVGNQTITVPYVYRKNVTVQTYGSVIATYKDEEGNELASTEKVITNQPGGTYYAAASKDIQGSAQSKVTPDGRTVTITTYKLIKTPDNETGDVRDGEIIEVPYVYRKNVEERLVPGNTPSVEIPELKVTQYQTEDGTDIKTSEQGFVDAPNTIDKYQFTGTTNTNEGGDVQTHIYKLIETDKPNDAPQVDVPALNVTRYVNEEGTEIKDAEEGLVPAPSMIGEHYQFTGRTETTEDGTVQTHIYKVVEHDVPGDAPKREPEEIQITLHVDEETGKELVEYDPGLTSPKEIEHYTYTGKTTQEEGIRIHYYKKVITEVPGDAPQVDIPELRLTRHVNEKGDELLPIEEGSNGPRKTIGDYEYTGRTDVEGGITTHVYAPIRYELPGDAPQYDIPELKVTRHVDEKGKELIETEKGNQPPRKTIGDNEYTGRTTEKDGITTHVYTPIKHEIPGDAPVIDVPQLKVTRYVNEKGEEIKESEAGFINAPKTIGEYEFTGKTELNDGKDVQTHIYKLVEKPVTPTPDPKKPETPSPRTPEPKKPETPQPEAPKPIEIPKSNDSKPVVAESVDQPQFVKNELPKTGETNSNLALVGVSLLTALGLIGFVKRKRED